MKTIYYTATSLDGFLATETDSLDWLFPLVPFEETGFEAFIGEVGAIAMGSVTYDWILDHHSEPAAEASSAWVYTQPSWIFSSRSLRRVEGGDLHFVSGDVRPVYEEMRAASGGKNLWIVGGGDLAGQFYDAGLLDEMVIQIGSVTLGMGKPLFPRRVTAPPLILKAVRQIGPGMAELRYEVPKAGG